MPEPGSPPSPLRAERYYVACYKTWFSASHLVRSHPVGGQPHGHDFMLRVCACSRQLDENGFVVDYYSLKQAVESLIVHLDHRLVNDVIGVDDASSERIAEWIMEWLAKRGLRRVCLVELCGPPDFCVYIAEKGVEAPL